MFAHKVLVDNPWTVDEAVGPQSMSSNEQLHQILVGNSHFTAVYSHDNNYCSLQHAASQLLTNIKTTDKNQF